MRSGVRELDEARRIRPASEQDASPAVTVATVLTGRECG